LVATGASINTDALDAAFTIASKVFAAVAAIRLTGQSLPLGVTSEQREALVGIVDSDPLIEPLQRQHPVLVI
jgi:hypothetical protein